jgi:signal transduction histidine kinase
MRKEETTKLIRPFRQRYFAARDLQFSVALLVVLALLGGIFLQTFSSALISRYGSSTPILGIFLIVGYFLIVVLIAVFFTHRLVGPFKRLEYEMKMISSGELAKRLSIRSQDDLHIRNFVRYTNNFISKFEEMSKEYNRLNSTVVKKMDDINAELSRKDFDCERLKSEISVLQKEIREFRERW